MPRWYTCILERSIACELSMLYSEELGLGEEANIKRYLVALSRCVAECLPLVLASALISAAESSSMQETWNF